MAARADRDAHRPRAPRWRAPQPRATDRRARGTQVEIAARRHLLLAGLEDIAANASCRLGEIDLVMADGDIVVFIEVRYRAGDAFGGGAASVDFAKQRRLVLAAEHFLRRTPSIAQRPCRFDVIEATGDPECPALRWLRGAFRADECRG